jgi:hypothetical protein
MLCYQNVRERNRESRGRLWDHALLLNANKRDFPLPNAKGGHNKRGSPYSGKVKRYVPFAAQLLGCIARSGFRYHTGTHTALYV